MAQIEVHLDPRAPSPHTCDAELTAVLAQDGARIVFIGRQAHIRVNLTLPEARHLAARLKQPPTTTGTKGVS